MKNFLSFAVLSFLLFFVFFLMFNEGNVADLVVMSVVMINIITMMMMKTMEYMREKLSNKKTKKETMFIEIFWAQLSFFISILLILYLISYNHEFNDWSILLSASTMLITAVNYLIKQVSIKGKDKIRILIETKDDSIAKEFYQFYYISIGVLLLIEVYCVILTITENFVYYQFAFIILSVIFVLQTIYTKTIIKSEKEN